MTKYNKNTNMFTKETRKEMNYMSETLMIPVDEREKEKELINIVLQFPKEEKDILLMCANTLRVRDNFDKKGCGSSTRGE